MRPSARFGFWGVSTIPASFLQFFGFYAKCGREGEAVAKVIAARYQQTSRPNKIIRIDYDDGTSASGLESAMLPQLAEWLAEGNEILPRLPKGYPSHEGRMAYTPNSALDQPADGTRVWRYMGFDQFCALLVTRSLWFSRVVALQSSDPFEGTMPLKNRNLYEAFSRLSTHLTTIDKLAIFNLVCCFNIEQHESNAMWNVYGKGANCVAIATTFSELAASFGTFSGNEVLIGRVKYIDYQVDEIGTHNFLLPLVHKAPFYDYEKELRCIIIDDGDDNIFPADEPNSWAHEGEFEAHHLAKYRRGAAIPVDLEKLIREVVVGPRAEPWFFDAVTGTLRQFGLSAPVRKSRLLG